MATFPSSQKFRFNGQPQSASSAVARSEMDRGVAKQRRFQADVVMTQTLTLLFRKLTEIDAFHTWFNSSISAGQDWFDFPLLRKEAGVTVVVQARFVGGLLGPLQHDGQATQIYSQEATVEWVEAAI